MSKSLLQGAGEAGAVYVRKRLLGEARVDKPEAKSYGTIEIVSDRSVRAHRQVVRGLRVARVSELMHSLPLIAPGKLFETIGISERTFQRRAAADPPTLDANASDRALRLATIVDLATAVLGSREEAQRWLTSPALGLERSVPIDLLQTSEGTEMVKALLVRMDYGVYA